MAINSSPEHQYFTATSSMVRYVLRTMLHRIPTLLFHGISVQRTHTMGFRTPLMYLSSEKFIIVCPFVSLWVWSLCKRSRGISQIHSMDSYKKWYSLSWESGLEKYCAILPLKEVVTFILKLVVSKWDFSVTHFKIISVNPWSYYLLLKNRK